MSEILRVTANEKEYSIRSLQQFGAVDPYLNPSKIQEIWLEHSKHDTLFSDYTRGDVQTFLDVLFNPRSVVAEIYSLDDELPVGLLMLTNIIPNFDAVGHFTFWDPMVRGREPIIWAMMNLWMGEFNLHRISARVPGPQRGVIRMVERLGFKKEGVMREGNLHRGTWVDLHLYGILQTELQELYNG